jgi:hypothetical protein
MPCPILTPSDGCLDLTRLLALRQIHSYLAKNIPHTMEAASTTAAALPIVNRDHRQQ